MTRVGGIRLSEMIFCNGTSTSCHDFFSTHAARGYLHDKYGDINARADAPWLEHRST